jgi:hypothetical protein
MKTSTKAQTQKSSTSERSKQKYPALMVNYNLKRRAEFIDYDYLDKLNDKEKRFLNKFTEETVNASFKPSGNIIKSKRGKRKIYNENNARNRDILTRKKITASLEYLDDDTKTYTTDKTEQVYANITLKQLGINPENYFCDKKNRWYKYVKNNKNEEVAVLVDLSVEFKKQIEKMNKGNQTGNNSK